MVGIIKEINGEKVIIPLTTDTGTGAPVGTLIQQYKKVPISGYLYCDGSTFDQNAYPALYMYLGTNVLPDYRECVMVGAEQNTTDTIATHDVYGEGEFKDDQLQIHSHSVPNSNPDGKNYLSLQYSNKGYYGNIHTSNNNGRTGDTTHGKQKAVYVYIKATSGLAENQQDNVLNDVKEYIRKSNELSPFEVCPISTTNQTAPYDGFLFIRFSSSDTVITDIYINDKAIASIKTASSDWKSIVIPICKGDTFRAGTVANIGYDWTQARWYKNR